VGVMGVLLENTRSRYVDYSIPPPGITVKPPRGRGRRLDPPRRVDHDTLGRYTNPMDTTTAPNHAEPVPEANGIATAPERRSTSYAADKAKILARLRRMEGQVRGVQKMVEEDQYCLDVLTQLSAIMSAARSAGLLVLEDHIRGCVLGTCRHGHGDQEEILAELSGAIERFTRTAS